jgi:UDP-glucose 4-epimerase
LPTCFENDSTGVLNIGSGKAVSFNQVVAELNQLLKTEIKPTYVTRPTSYLDSTLCQPEKMIQVWGESH